MGFFSGIGSCLSDRTILVALSENGAEKRSLAWSGDGEWWVKATFCMPLTFFHLFFPQDFMTIKLGAERFRFAEQPLQYSISLPLRGKEWFLAEF